MKAKIKLSRSMTLTQFEHGYWYLSDLKEFAENIGVPSASRLRKDELEKAIMSFLESGEIHNPTKRKLSKSGIKDVEKGLNLRLPITHYTGNKETKLFIINEAKKLLPSLKTRSGVWYRLNRWREEQLTRGANITYLDLVKHYIALNKIETAFAKIPHGRYINFISEFLANEMNATRDQAIDAWNKLKEMNIPKNYRSWVDSVSSKQRKNA